MTSLPSLAIDQFDSYFHGLWGKKPYRWQRALAEEAVRDRQWPEALDLPTGSGKTAILDIATFVLAIDADSPAGLRWAPTRTVLVVDRRIIVDQAGFRGEAIAHKLRQANSEASAEAETLRSIAARLRSLASDPGRPHDRRAPIVSGVLRGGIVRDETWAERPDRPALLISTVDQVGSRLLFQGYGLSRGARPIHAGLLTNDTLLVLDEVHLAVPFAETLGEIQALRSDGDRNRFHVLEMSATPSRSVTRVFPHPASRPGLLDDEAIRQRLTASKPVRLAELVKGSDTAKSDTDFAKACVSQAIDLLKGGTEAKVVGVMVNRVDTARSVADDLATAGYDIVLLTGRMRPYDRDAILNKRWGDDPAGPTTLEVLCDRTRRGTLLKPLVVVGTQTLEAGADFDLDGIVCECASYAAVIQRFGRVDRAGSRSASGTPTVSTLLARASSLADDAVYGDAIGATWAWLSEKAHENMIDLGVSAIAEMGEAPLTTRTDSAFAPLTEPHHLDMWVQTSHPPTVVPDVSSWLHGLGKRPTDVQIIWRADVTPETLERASSGDEIALDELRLRLAALPPRSPEALSVPIGAAARWLRGGEAARVFDVDGVLEVHDASRDTGFRETANKRSTAKPFLRKGPDEWAATTAVNEIRPGDTIVVAVEHGGIGPQGTWDPLCTLAVRDIAEEAALDRGWVVVRLDSALQGDRGGLQLDAVVTTRPSVLELPTLDAEDDDGTIVADVTAWLNSMREKPIDRTTRDAVVVALLAGDDEPRVSLIRRDPGDLVAVARWRRSASPTTGPTHDSIDLEDEDDDHSFTGDSKVTLERHLNGVRDWARTLATNLGLSPELVSDLAFAGWLHDLGKADPRFQSWLNGGAARIGELIAKSSARSDDPRTRRRARQQSGYPQGMRHELLSLALIDGVEELQQQAYDWELVCHLVAAHHGWCRPFAPPQPDRRPIAVTLDEGYVGVGLAARTDHNLDDVTSQIASRFWRMTRRYGWFQLAWLETILRLADHRESESEVRR